MPVKNEKQNKFSVTLRKDGIVEIVEQSKPTEESALDMCDQVIKKGKGENDKILLDLSKAGIPPARSRKSMSNIFIKSKPAKVAVIGAGIALKVMAKFIMLAAGIKNFEFFDTEKEAVEWLNK